METTKIRELITQKNDADRGLALKPVMKHLMSFVSGFLMMNPFVLGRLSPFSISLAAALKDSCSAWVCAGGILGSFVFFSGTQTVKYSAVLLLFILIKGIASRLLENELKSFFSYINAFCCMFVIGSAIMFATGFDFEEFLAVGYESALASAGAYIFASVSETLWGKNGAARLTTWETAQILSLFGIVLMHFYRYKIFDFSPVITVFCFLILVFARLKNESGGVLAGICLSLAAGLSGDMGFVCVGFALGGLISGELIRKNRQLCTLGFFVPVVICSVADGTLSAYTAIAESLVACAVFLIVPESLFSRLCEKLNTTVPISIRSDDSIKTAKRLNDISAAVAQVSECVSTVRNAVKPVPREKLNSAVRSTWQKVCRNCDLNGSCRNEIKNPSDETVERIANALISGAELDETRFPKGFYSSCYSFAQMQSGLLRRYADFTASLGAMGEVHQMQELMSDQFKNMSDILHRLAEDFDEKININSEAADCCAAEAVEFGLNVIGANSYLDKFGRLSLSLNIIPRREFSTEKLTESLSSAIGTPLELTETKEHDNGIILNFSQKISFCISIGAFSKPVDNESVCGDYYRSFRDDNGRYIALLSDGMGTGKRAAVDSAMAAELFTKLVRSEMSFDCALSVTNAALLAKGGDESLSTLDVVCVDLYTGKTDFMKAGAAATFIRRHGQVIKLEQESMPLGILREAEFASAFAHLDDGDVILMVSDGILGDCNGWIQQELKLWSTRESAQELAKFIVDSAVERKLAKHRDDMTAVAVYIKSKPSE